MGGFPEQNQEPYFYPAGWHDFVYLIYNTTGTSIATANHHHGAAGGRASSGPGFPGFSRMCLSIPALRRHRRSLFRR